MSDLNVFKELIEEEYSWRQIAEKMDWTYQEVINFKTRNKLKSKFSHKRSLSWEKIENNGFYLIGDKSTTQINSKALFVCPICKSPFEAIPSNLRRMGTRSCGCVILGGRKGGKYITGERYAQIKNRYKKRDMEFNISVEYIETLLENQHFKCSLTNLRLNCDDWSNNWDASLDRIDSSKGYTVGNVQWVHKDINLMKNHFPENYFISMCDLVSLYSETKKRNENHKTDKNDNTQSKEK